MAGVRPKDEFNWTLFERVCGLPPIITNEDIAFLMECSVDTCANRIKDKYPGLTFSEFRDKRGGTFRQRLLAKQYDVAMRGNPAMLIWLGKQYLNQTDKVEPKDPGNRPSQLVIDLSGASFVKEAQHVDQNRSRDSQSSADRQDLPGSAVVQGVPAPSGQVPDLGPAPDAAPGSN